MSTSQINEKWNELKVDLKIKIADLTDNDKTCADGKREEMIRKLEIELGKTKEELRDIISGH